MHIAKYAVPKYLSLLLLQILQINFIAENNKSIECYITHNF